MNKDYSINTYVHIATKRRHASAFMHAGETGLRSTTSKGRIHAEAHAQQFDGVLADDDGARVGTGRAAGAADRSDALWPG
jgi:hypothetical protein